MLHHDEGVAQITEAAQRRQQLVVIPLVKPDGRLVQNIQHAHETAADLGRQTDTLALAAGKGARCAGEGEVAQAHGLQKAQTGADLFQYLGGDKLLVAGELQTVEEGEGVVHRKGGGVVDGSAAHGDCQRLGTETPALTRGTGTGGHQTLDLALAGIGLSLLIAAFQIVADALEGLVENALAPGLVVVKLQLFALGAVEDHVLDLVGQAVVGLGQGEAVLLAEGFEIHTADAVGADGRPARGGDGSVQNGFGAVGDDEGGIRLELLPETGAGGAGPEGAVEGEKTGRQLLDGDAAVVTGVVLGEGDILFLPQKVDRHQSARQIGGGLHGVGEPAGNIGADDKAIHHDVDVVLAVLFQRDALGQLVEAAVHPRTDEAAPPRILQHLGVLTLASAHHGSHHLNTGALRESQYLVDDLIHRLAADLLAAVGAVGRAHSRPEQAQVVVDLRHRAHGGAGVLGGGFLVDGDGGGKPLDIVHVGLVHLP